MLFLAKIILAITLGIHGRALWHKQHWRWLGAVLFLPLPWLDLWGLAIWTGLSHAALADARRGSVAAWWLDSWAMGMLAWQWRALVTPTWWLIAGGFLFLTICGWLGSADTVILAVVATGWPPLIFAWWLLIACTFGLVQSRLAHDRETPFIPAMALAWGLLVMWV
ncbi:hypothetical protein [Lacticaseibacillus mingshuiensis]|uniref:Prepilin type IV endopeptidase peptidase domain-containing protein n=1 Tax=Lacticaseibacillus mingshuiensis TaxID=2799574 RepID=A0ABW4CKK9_9LACO|nr:hypothetical protein [Lacticaseibacillus mingshuiensis]